MQKNKRREPKKYKNWAKYKDKIQANLKMEEDGIEDRIRRNADYI